MAVSNKIDRSTLARITASLHGTILDRVRDLLPWLALCGALGLVLSGLWLREQDEQQHAPMRRTEVQLRELKALDDAGWKMWLGNEIVASHQLENVADAWVSLTKEHPGLPSVAPERLAQVDGGRVTVLYTNEASSDDVLAHAEAAAPQTGVVQVWTDESGFDHWAEQAAVKRQSSILIAIVSVLLFAMACKSVWAREWERSRAWRTMMTQLGLSARAIESRFRRALGMRVVLAGAMCIALFVPLHSWLQSEESMDAQALSKATSQFRPRTMEIPLASDFPCGPECTKDSETRAEHSYLVEHKLGVLARQDRALDRHEKALRPWLWSLSRRPSTLAQRTVLSANLVNPELQARFSAWDTEDKAFKSSLREVEALASRMQNKMKLVKAKGPAEASAFHACDAGQAPWAKKSLALWVPGKVQAKSSSEKLAGLQEPAMRILASEGAKVRASVGAEVAAILRDTPGRFTLVLDSGQSWIWALGGIAALEVHTGDRVKAGEVLGEVARPGPQDEGVSALEVELWRGSRQADPQRCFRVSVNERSQSRKSLGSASSARYNAR